MLLFIMMYIERITKYDVIYIGSTIERIILIFNIAVKKVPVRHYYIIYIYLFYYHASSCCHGA